MPERGRLVRPVLPIEEAHRKEANAFDHGLEAGGRAARAPARPTYQLCGRAARSHGQTGAPWARPTE